MFKIALAVGISYEWLCGPGFLTIRSFAGVAVRTLCATLLAWMVLETFYVLYRAAMSLDPRAPGRRSRG